jgi:glutamyl-tRNA synthetase
VGGPLTPVITDPALVGAAAETLPSEPWDGSTWKTWTDTVKGRTGAKGRALFMPLRLALTGVDHGPELAALMPLIGRDRASRRLRGETA